MPVMKMYNVWDKKCAGGIKYVFDIAIEKINELEDITVKTIQNETQIEIRIKKWKNSVMV